LRGYPDFFHMLLLFTARHFAAPLVHEPKRFSVRRLRNTCSWKKRNQIPSEIGICFARSGEKVPFSFVCGDQNAGCLCRTRCQPNKEENKTRAGNSTERIFWCAGKSVFVCSAAKTASAACQPPIIYFALNVENQEN
jgi:hypothetical protein